MVGKWHLAKDSDCSAAGPQHSWPCQRGFDRFFGFLDAFTNLHQPHRLTEDNHQVEVDRYPDDYYLTDDLTDRAVAMVRERKASNPDQPFLLYFAHGAVHAPLQAKAVDMARYRGAYRAGWDALRAERYQRQLDLGVHPRGHAVGPSQHRAEPRRAAVGRAQRARAAALRPAHGGLRRHGRQHRPERGSTRPTRWTSWASSTTPSSSSPPTTAPPARARSPARSSYYVHLLQGDDVDADLARIDLLGGPQTTPHYPRGWAMASNTPFAALQDQHPRRRPHRAVHRVVARAPGRPRRGAARASTPTSPTCSPRCCELIGVERPADRHGVQLAPLAGTSFAPTLTAADAPSRHTRQVEEMNGHRGYYEDGWEIVTLHQPLTPFDDGEWELYDLTDRSHRAPRPRRRAPGQGGRAGGQVGGRGEGRGRSTPWTRAAPSSTWCARPGATSTANRCGSCAGTPSLERWRSVQLIWFRSASIAVELRLPVRRPGHAGGPRRPGRRLRALRARRRAVVRPQRRSGHHAPAVGWCSYRRHVVGRGRSWSRGGGLDGHAVGRGRRQAPCSRGAGAGTASRRSRASTSASTAARRWTGSIYERVVGSFRGTGRSEAGTTLRAGRPGLDRPTSCRCSGRWASPSSDRVTGLREGLQGEPRRRG